MFRWALVIGCTLAAFQQLTGINVVIFYSNKVFVSGSVPGKQTYSDLVDARTGTVVVGIVNWAATMVTIPLLGRLGRKVLLLIGHTGMLISLVALGICAIFNDNMLIILFTVIFIAFFEIGVGSVLFLYAAEIMTEIGVSMALVVCWSLTILISMITPRMILCLGQKGLYFMFAGINVVGWLFI